MFGYLKIGKSRIFLGENIWRLTTTDPLYDFLLQPSNKEDVGLHIVIEDTATELDDIPLISNPKSIIKNVTQPLIQPSKQPSPPPSQPLDDAPDIATGDTAPNTPTNELAQPTIEPSNNPTTKLDQGAESDMDISPPPSKQPTPEPTSDPSSEPTSDPSKQPTTEPIITEETKTTPVISPTEKKKPIPLGPPKKETPPTYEVSDGVEISNEEPIIEDVSDDEKEPDTTQQLPTNNPNVHNPVIFSEEISFY